MFAFASSWNMYSLPVRLAGSPLHRSFDSTPNVTPCARRISNSDRSDFWKSASNAPAQPSHTSTSCFAGIEGLERRRLDELLPLVVAEAPDVAAALEVVVHAAEIVGRLAVRHQAAPRADDERQVLDADRALVLAGAAGRALPEHLLGVDLAELASRARRRAAPPASAG